MPIKVQEGDEVSFAYFPMRWYGALPKESASYSIFNASLTPKWGIQAS